MKIITIESEVIGHWRKLHVRGCPDIFMFLQENIIFMLAEGRAYSRCFVHLPDRLSHVCLEQISKSIEGNLMKLDTLIDIHEGNCRLQEP